jgi:hypothetical protein
MFDQLDEVLSVHEPQPELFVEAYQTMYGLNTFEQIIEALKRKRPERRIKQPFFLESSIWLSYLIEELAVAFPNCKFIWLTRNIYTWAHSAARRGWYRKGTMCPAMSVLRPEPADGWKGWGGRADSTQYFKLGWFYGTLWRITQNSLVNAERPWIPLSMECLNDAVVMNTVRRWCEFPGDLHDGAWENKGDSYATEAELKAWKLWDKIPKKVKMDKLKDESAMYDIYMSRGQQMEVRGNILFPGFTTSNATDLQRGFVAGIGELLGKPVPAYWVEAAAKHHKIVL